MSDEAISLHNQLFNAKRSHSGHNNKRASQINGCQPVMKAIFVKMTKQRIKTSFRETKRTSLYSKICVPLGQDEEHRFAALLTDKMHSSIKSNKPIIKLVVI